MSSQKSKRRSSMSMLRNIPTSELAEIINGNSPNPILDTPPVDLVGNLQHPLTTVDQTIIENPDNLPSSSEATTSISADGVPLYQHSMHTLLKKQLSNKRKSTKDRRSLPHIDPNQQELDRDVDEMSLDNEPPPSNVSGKSESSRSDNAGRSGLYPAMLLKEAPLKIDVDKQQQQQRRSSMSSSVSASSLNRPPITETSTWTHSDQSGDYFGTDALKSTSKCKCQCTIHI
jgi:hypothetical protein